MKRYRGDAADRLAERDRFLRNHGDHSLRWFAGDEDSGYFDGLACDTHEVELQLIPPNEQEARPENPVAQAIRQIRRAVRS